MAKTEWPNDELGRLLLLESRSDEVSAFFAERCAEAGFLERMLTIAEDRGFDAVRVMVANYSLAQLKDHEESLLRLHASFDTSKERHLPVFELLSDILSQLGSPDAKDRIEKRLRRLELANKHRGGNHDLNPLKRSLERYNGS